MTISRRGFLGGLAGILAAGAAPSIIRAENAMKIIVPKAGIWVPNNALSQVFDLEAATQDEFGEAFYPTLIITQFESFGCGRWELRAI